MANIIRVKKETNYTVLDNTFIEDEKLDWKQKGLLCYLLHLPNDWNINLADLSKRSATGRDSTANTLNSLIKHGYVKRERETESGKFAGYDYKVYEKPYTENTDTENPNTENTTLLNTNEQSTKKINTNNPSRHKYGEFKKVLLSDEELDKIKEKFTDWQHRIQKLDDYLANHKDNYTSHYRTILIWAKKDKPQTDHKTTLQRLIRLYGEDYDKARVNMPPDLQSKIDRSKWNEIRKMSEYDFERWKI